jgi:hypothetical protein
MEKREFINILDDMINNTDKCIIKVVNKIDNDKNETAYIKFKTNNKELFYMFLSETRAMKKMDNYNFISDENKNPSEYSIEEKVYRINKLNSVDSKKSNLSAIKDLFEVILSGANAENLISNEEKSLYMDVIEDSCKYKSPTELIKNKYKTVKDKVKKITNGI